MVKQVIIYSRLQTMCWAMYEFANLTVSSLLVIEITCTK